MAVRIAFLDDDADFLASVSKSLQTQQVNVRTFTSSDEFLADSRDHAYDAAILDLQLENGPQEGLDVAKRLSLWSPKLPIFVLSSVPDPWSRARLRDLGLPMVPKADIDFAALVRSIESAVASSRTDFSWTQTAPSLAPEIDVIQLDLLNRIQPDPTRLYGLEPREFERFVADLLSAHRFEVQLTKPSWDGGVDIFAIRRDVFSGLYVVQCKRYKREHKVELREVRELYGVKSDFAATKAVLATTSFFTEPARTFEEKHKWELELKDYNDLVLLLRSATRTA